MHTARQLDVSMFTVRRGGAVATREDLFPDWTTLDRLGVVVREPFGSIGASHLIQLAITAFYDGRPARRAGRLDGEDPKAIYPEIYLFHVGGSYGDHSAFDFWPARKEVPVPAEPRLVLDAINDRAITRLAVPDTDPVKVAHEHMEPAAARDRIVTAVAYAADGRPRRGDWSITGQDRRTELNPADVLRPDEYAKQASSVAQPVGDDLLADRSWPSRLAARRMEAREGLALARRRREDLYDDAGCATESYRTISVDEALGMLV
jgi:hypothetical protein